MGGHDLFETTGRRSDAGAPRHARKLVVAALVVVLLAGGAFYNARISESTPKVVYSVSLEEAKREAQAPLLVNVNTADVEELDELPQVGPSTAAEIIAHREANGPFASVDELEAVSGIGPKTVEEIRPFATV